MYCLVILLSALFVPAAPAQTLDIADLGRLELRYRQVAASDEYPGRPLAARAWYRAGDALSLVTPVRVQQISYLPVPGDAVREGEVIARLDGPEIHHFITEFKVLEQRLAVAEQRFNNNRSLYQRQAIDEGRWIEISEAYYALQLEHEHMRHFRELLSEAAAGDNSLLLRAPHSGLLQYRQDAPGLERGQEVAVIIPPKSLRLRVSIPLAQRQALSSLAFADCKLPVASVSGIADDYFVSAWSAPLAGTCALLPGERLMVTPWFAARAYRTPASAVMQWNGGPAVLVKHGDTLEVVPVQILSAAQTDYYVRCDADLADRSVLSSSVSAVQGILIGLGGE